MSLVKKIKNLGKKLIAKETLVNTTAILVVANPPYAYNEVIHSGQSDLISIKTRLVATIVNYAGMGFLYERGRNYMRSKLGIKDNSNELVQTSTDAIYGSAFSVPLTIGFAFAAGERNPEVYESLVVANAYFGAVLGVASGYVIDIAKDLMGMGECNRFGYGPIRKQSEKIKRTIAAGMVAISLSSMGALYAISDNHAFEFIETQETISAFDTCNSLEAKVID
jgi:hypothetical protein